MALRLGRRRSVQAELATPINQETAPTGCTVTYEFPAREEAARGPHVLVRARLPPAGLFQGQKPSGSGCLMIGAKGTLYSPSDYGGAYRLLPKAISRAIKPPQPTLPRSPATTREWINACKGARRRCPTSWTTPASDRDGPAGQRGDARGQAVVWDTEKLRAIDHAAANQYIRRKYRKGWEL